MESNFEKMVEKSIIQTPLISFIIPYYNLSKSLIERCIDSIISQNLDESLYEIWIIDDGSSCSPRNIIQHYSQSNLFYHLQSHSGQGGARNLGMLLARGTYIQFVDGDDYLIENSVQRYIPLLKENKDIDILSFDFLICKDFKPVNIGQSALKTCKTNGIAFMLSNNLPATPCKFVFRKELAIRHQVKFTERIFHEDEEFTPSLYIHAQKVLLTNVMVYAYYTRSGSTTKNRTLRHVYKRLFDMKYVLSMLQDHSKHLKPKEREAFNRKINQLTMDFMIRMMCEHRSFYYLRKQLRKLHKMGLYPLAPKNYTYKYTLFRWLSSNIVGLRFLKLTLPLFVKL
jgi:glycosyltransferase involved in cell wall biosynthesis